MLFFSTDAFISILIKTILISWTKQSKTSQNDDRIENVNNDLIAAYSPQQYNSETWLKSLPQKRNK